LSKNVLVIVLRGVSLGLLLGVLGPVACHSSSTPDGSNPSLGLQSSSFPQGEIAKQFTCDGAGRSPALSWGAPPAGTRSFALVVIDKDSPFGSFVHWVLYDLPPDKRSLPEGLPQQGQLPAGARQGSNDFGSIGYGGPCPPGKSPHRYLFTLYALNSTLNLPPGATEKQVVQAIKTHVLAQSAIVGRYQR
jgi:Raf kinase inhibitor-like YbhB/YbcL family protein